MIKFIVVTKTEDLFISEFDTFEEAVDFASEYELKNEIKCIVKEKQYEKETI